MIKFNFDDEKFFSVMQILSTETSGLDVLKAIKMLYFIDREHLRTYGQPVLGDEYKHMQMGPVPSRAYDILKNIRDGKPNQLLKIDITQLSSGNHPIFVSVAAPDLTVFSDVEKATIKRAIKDFGNLTGNSLSDISHQHETWNRTKPNESINYELFFAESPAECQDALEFMRLEQENRDFVDGI